MAFAAVPGLWLLRVVRFQYRSQLDLVLALSASGLAVSGGCVYFLLLAGLYYSFTPFLILLLPAAWLAYEHRRTGRLLPEVLPPSRKLEKPGRSVAALNRIAASGCGILLFVLFCDAVISPLRMWDAVITWDRWATDWAARTDLYHYAQGGYPQLLPMFSSLLYKATGSYSQAVPDEQYALHAFHAVLGVLLLLAVLRAAQLFALPAWGALATVFGFTAMQGIITFGTADLLVTLLFLVTVVLWFGWRGGEWEARFDGVPILIACAFATSFSKAGGIAAILFLALANVRLHRGSGSIPAARYLRGRPLAMALAAPVMLLVPFYLAQIAASREPLDRHRPLETNFVATRTLAGLTATADNTYAGRDGFGRFQGAAGRVLDSYSVPRKLRLPAGALLVILACAGGLSGTLPPVFFTALVLSITWYRVTSYDLRNLLPAIPLLGVCITAGAVRIWKRIERYRWARAALIATVSLFLVLAAATAASIAPQFFRASFSGGKWAARLEAAQAGMPERIEPFFPDDYRMWMFLSRVGLVQRAHHLVAYGAMYRWHTGGIYPGSDWNPRILEPGDLFVAQAPILPPGRYDDWTLLPGPGPYRAWLLER